MRLRKNMKRTAAVVLALSMAVSAVAAPASAAYICDVSQGSVEVSVNEKGEKTIKVGDDSVTIKKDGTKETTGKGIKDDGTGVEGIIITGDNTKPTESLNAEEENTSEAEKSGETPPRLKSPARPRSRPRSPALWSCWPRRTRRSRPRRRRLRRSPPTLRSRNRPKRPNRPPIR